MSYLAAFGRYASSFIGVTLLTSFAFQNLLHRRVSTAERDRLVAHKSILESLVTRLKGGEDLTESEIVRLVRLARGGGEQGGGLGDTPWSEVVFGKRAREAKAVEGKALEEWDAAIAQAEEAARHKPPPPPPVPALPTPSPPSLPPLQSQKKPTFL